MVALKYFFSFYIGIAPGWATGVEDHFVAQAKYDFTGQGNDELTFKAGQNINVAPKGTCKQSSRQEGVFDDNFCYF